MPPFHNFTVKAQEAIRRAHELAIERGQNQVDAMHLLGALVLQDDGMVISILDKLEIDTALLTDSVLDALDGGARSKVVMPSPQIYLTPELGRSLEEAHKAALSLKDEYISTEHLFLGILEVNSKARELLSRFRMEKEAVLRALAERFMHVQAVREVKKSAGLPPLDEVRWQEVIKSRLALAKELGLPLTRLT